MKRAFDLFIVVLLVPFWAVLILILTVLCFLLHGMPIYFRQIRPGLRSKAFILYKFRTMLDKYSSDGILLPDGERLTAFGRFLRKTSLDELPELWNVLKGDMSLVGPRPLLTSYLERYSREQARRHDVKPGITGWAQINGRNAISWEEKFKLDVWYVDNWSLWLDVKIIALTIKKVLFHEGISQKGHAAMEEFRGLNVFNSKQDR